MIGKDIRFLRFRSPHGPIRLARTRTQLRNGSTSEPLPVFIPTLVLCSTTTLASDYKGLRTSCNTANSSCTTAAADDIDLSDVDIKFHHRIREILQKHENMWNGRVGHINVADQAVDLNAGAEPFRSALYRSGPTA